MITLRFTVFVLAAIVATSAAAATSAPNPQALADQMTKNATEQAREEFEKIHTAHGTIRAVEDVEKSLARAIKSCAEHQPDLKAKVTEHFQKWKNEVRPTLRQARHKLDKMILTQTIGKPAAVREYLKSFDAAIAAQRAAVTEIPIKDAQACQAMMNNLAESQKTMASLIRETLGLPDPSTKGPATPQP